MLSTLLGPTLIMNSQLPALLPGAPLCHLLLHRGRHPRLDALVLRLRRPRPLVLRPPRQDRAAIQAGTPPLGRPRPRARRDAARVFRGLCLGEQGANSIG